MARVSNLQLITSVILTLALLGCNDERPLVAPDVSVDDPDAFVIDGTVRFFAIEGGCWSIAGDDGVTYEPIGLPEEFLKNGLRVRAAVKLRLDLFSICMIGTIVEILEIKRYMRG